MRRHWTTTSWLCSPSTSATISCVSVGCCVLLWTKTRPPSSTRASEHVLGHGERGVDVASREGRLPALEGVRRDRGLHREDRGQRFVVDLDDSCAETGRLEGLAEHPAHGVAPEHDLGREERLVALDAGLVVSGDVVGREHADDAGHVVRRVDLQAGDHRMGVRGLHRPGVQDVLGLLDEVVGVERSPTDVLGGGLVLHRHSDDRVRGAIRQGGHAVTSVRLPA
jgi:hypothetical protein